MPCELSPMPDACVDLPPPKKRLLKERRLQDPTLPLCTQIGVLSGPCYGGAFHIAPGCESGGIFEVARAAGPRALCPIPAPLGLPISRAARLRRGYTPRGPGRPAQAPTTTRRAPSARTRTSRRNPSSPRSTCPEQRPRHAPVNVNAAPAIVAPSYVRPAIKPHNCVAHHELKNPDVDWK